MYNIIMVILLLITIVDINRRARLIRDHYDFQIKERFEELEKKIGCGMMMQDTL